MKLDRKATELPELSNGTDESKVIPSLRKSSFNTKSIFHCGKETPVHTAS